MTDPKDGARDGQKAGDGPGQKRPHATIELKATEIKPAAAPATASTTQASATAQTASGAAQPVSGAPGASGAQGAAPGGEPGRGTAGARVTPEVLSSPPRRRGGFFSHLVASVAGGVVALVAADQAGERFGLMMPAAADLKKNVTEMSSRMAAVEAALRDKVGSGDFGKLVTTAEARLGKVGEFETALAALTDAQGKLAASTVAAEVAVQQSSERVAKLDERFAALVAAAESTGDKGRVAGYAALSEKIAGLSDGIETRLTNERKAMASEIDGRLSQVAETSKAAMVGADALSKEVGAVKAETMRLGERVEMVKTFAEQQAAALETIKSEAVATSNGLAWLKGAVEQQMMAVARPADVASAVSPVTGKLAEVERRLDTVMKSEGERQANASRVVMALELSNLKRAVEGGKGFANELATITSAAGDSANLAALEPYKDSGVASFAALEKDLQGVIRNVLDTEPGESAGDGSLLGQIVSNARSMVKIRKVDHASDDKSAEAVLSRMEKALAGRQLDVVLSEAKDLPEKAVGVAKGWLQQVEARQAADLAIAALEAQVKSSLSAAAGGATSNPQK